VVDASVVAAAFFPEPGRDAARAILASGGTLLAPDLLLAEVASVMWKRHGRGELAASEAEALLADVLRLPIEYVPAAGLIDVALPLALRTGRTVYDCLYLALAIRHRTVLVTGDLRLVNALSRTPLAAYVSGLVEAARNKSPDQAP
jgi:predicted nucleic acid-binding protein